YASPSQINFVVPWSAPTTSFSDLQVVQVSTGRVLAAGLVSMNSVSPAIFTGATISPGRVQAAVINNKDGTVNGPTNPAARGDFISIYATGQGYLTNPPADGDNPPSPISTDSSINLRVIMGSQPLDSFPLQPGEKVSDNCPKFLCYSGTSSYPGLWQINVQIPQGVDPTTPAAVALNVNGITSNGTTANTAIPVIFVK
ncbi:MAG TPA: hypothetical protein VKE70_17005, partial [Candidatus Solibacter sp.]|nr:hypothetical protein [Candidatus Solibacter sp.]